MKRCVRAQSSLDLPEGWPEPWLGFNTSFSEPSPSLGPALDEACKKKFLPDLFPIKLVDLLFFP